jgi:hypothetical protein
MAHLDYPMPLTPAEPGFYWDAAEQRYLPCPDADVR